MNNKKSSSINNNESNFLTKIKSIKNIKLIVCLLVLAVILFSISVINNKNEVQEKPVNMTPTEERLANMICAFDEIDSCEVYINYDKEDSFFGGSRKINGVLVMCKGTNTVSNKLKILNALQKALNIDKDIIEILIL